MMFNRVSEWLDVVLETNIPNEVVAFGFNLYEDSHYNWSMELIGASEFDIDNEDWLCSEVTDFNTRDNPLRWHKEAGWEEILNEIVCALKEYLKNGKYADILKTKSGVGVGFVDGSIEILYAKIKEKIWRLIEQKISEWQEDDIYAISLYVFDEEDDPRRPVSVLGYNTERQVQKSITEASDEQEARWNYAFWLQNDEMCLGRDDTAEDIREWITEQDLWESEDAINSKFVDLLVAVVQDIHASGLLKDKFGREIPILIHELEYYEKIARQNIEANGETLDRDFVSFCMPYLPEVQNEMQTSQNEMSKAEKCVTSPQSRSFVIGKKSTDMRKVAAFIIAVILIMSLFWVLGLIISSRNKTNSEDIPQQTEHFDELTTEFMAGNEEQSASESAPEAEKDSFFLRNAGRDGSEVEIFFKDCVCEYDRDGIRVYTCFVDDPAVETEGYAICIQSSEKTEGRFSKDYILDKDAGCIYSLLVEMRDGIEIFTRISAEFVNGTANYVIADTYIMEGLIAEAYGLKYLDNDEDFDCQQVEFTGLYDKNGKTVLCGKASALYNASGKKYSIEWEIDTETIHESAKAYLSDFDIHPLYAAFLLNELSVENPFVPEGYGYSTELTYFDDRVDYDAHFWKSFSLVDVNNDDAPELVFKMYDSPSEVVYILGVQDEKLICYDILETHTTHAGFFIYDNGIVKWGQNYDGEGERYYTFTEDGKERELIHFIREADSDSDLYYGYYYLEGNKEARYILQGDEEYESLVSSYEGEKLEWFECESFADIPQNQGISKTEIVEKNAKNTGELRISTSITRLWLNEDEEGAAEINAALREIYEAAEVEMEVYNQEILDEYLFEDGVLQEDLDEWLLYPLEEWLAISTVNYVASIEYVDENYLCLSMNGDNYVAGGAHGYYWSDYCVFDRHTGQRLSLEDFVDDNAEDIKEIVKNHIVAAMPYSKGEQAENALEQNRFFLTAEGLGIHYDVYEIGDYASGSFDLVIPFELFSMKEDMWP